ncbi:MAG: hypothetical protein CM15mP21_4710 [Hyphomicrobiales bacterium]|nr:MAG: hypothetical protein CM15mP21_4710 [Hyphomicrobiales bacterium]
MPARKLGSEKGRAAQIHALAHIELNAIDLACDMAGRFCDRGWTTALGDWLSIAADGAAFLMLEKRLNNWASAMAIFLPMMVWEAHMKTHDPFGPPLSIVPMVFGKRGSRCDTGHDKTLQQSRRYGHCHILGKDLEDEKTHGEPGLNGFTGLFV